MCPNKTLQKLIDGNNRFAQGQSIHPNLGVELRSTLINEQNPYAAILSCSDSRVPIEIIFDVGLGELFVVRSAGHVLSKETLGSLEYAVGELGVNLILILGHDNCGAVKAALNFYNTNKYKDLSPNLQAILNHIYPVFKDLEGMKEEDKLNAAIRANIKYQVDDLINTDSYLAQKVKDKELIVVGANYCLESGIIEIFEEDNITEVGQKP